MADCMEQLSDLLEEEVKSSNAAKAELQKSKREAKLLKAEQKVKEINENLRKQVASLQTHNVVRRLQRRDEDLEAEAKENQKLNMKIEKLESRIQELQRQKKNVGSSRHHFMISLEKCTEAKKDLKKQVKMLEIENDDLKCQLDDIMNEQEVVSFEKRNYTNDIRLVCFELIARGVGSKHVSDIIKIVLRDVGKMKVGKLPKLTLIRYLAIEQAMLNKESARSKIENTTSPVTLHTDGTTKKRKGYTSFLASTDEGTVGMSLHDIETENAEALLQDTEETLDELCKLSIDNKDEVHSLLAKFKNTMTDRCIVNKAHITKLEKWRSSILPKVTENWDELDDGIKQEMCTINDLYCGKHLVLNLQEYAAGALCEWEKIESQDGKLGREKKLLWNRSKAESATILTVRSFCNLLGPDCCEQSGMVEEFKAIVGSSHLHAYRGNRFNIPFLELCCCLSSYGRFPFTLLIH